MPEIVVKVQSEPKDLSADAASQDQLLETVMQIVMLQSQRGDLDLECDCQDCLFEYAWYLYEKVSPFKKVLAA